MPGGFEVLDAAQERRGGGGDVGEELADRNGIRKVSLAPPSIAGKVADGAGGEPLGSLGEGSGTVNLVASTANLSRASSHAELRFDDLGGWRTSLDLNRPLLRGKVAVRVSAVYQHDEYKQKPSGFETRRFNFMLRAQPFKDTSIRASFNSYHGVGTRATAKKMKIQAYAPGSDAYFLCRARRCIASAEERLQIFKSQPKKNEHAAPLLSPK